MIKVKTIRTWPREADGCSAEIHTKQHDEEINKAINLLSEKGAKDFNVQTNGANDREGGLITTIMYNIKIKKQEVCEVTNKPCNKLSYCSGQDEDIEGFYCIEESINPSGEWGCSYIDHMVEHQVPCPLNKVDRR